MLNIGLSSPLQEEQNCDDQHYNGRCPSPKRNTDIIAIFYNNNFNIYPSEEQSCSICNFLE